MNLEQSIAFSIGIARGNIIMMESRLSQEDFNDFCDHAETLITYLLEELKKEEQMSKKEATERTPEGIEYQSESAGSQGARYYLIMRKGEFNKEQIDKSKAWLRSNFDVVNITVENNIYVKKKGSVD